MNEAFVQGQARQQGARYCCSCTNWADGRYLSHQYGNEPLDLEEFDSACYYKSVLTPRSRWPQVCGGLRGFASRSWAHCFPNGKPTTSRCLDKLSLVVVRHTHLSPHLDNTENSQCMCFRICQVLVALTLVYLYLCITQKSGMVIQARASRYPHIHIHQNRYTVSVTAHQI
jgi:hypothetical protein